MKRFSNFSVACVFTLGMLAGSASSQNLFLNPGFENIPGLQGGQGLLPSNWLALPSSSPDTYSNDGLYGLAPGDFGNFPGVSAHGGIRWIAGFNNDEVARGETFAQTLSAPLIAGQRYVVYEWLHEAVRIDLNSPGGYDLWLDTGDFDDRLLVGHIGDTSSPTAGWRLYFDDFICSSSDLI